MDITDKIKAGILRQIKIMRDSQPIVENTPEQDLAEIKQKLAEVENKIITERQDTIDSISPLEKR